MQTASIVARLVMLAIVFPLIKEIQPDSDIPLLDSEKLGRAKKQENATVHVVNELENVVTQPNIFNTLDNGVTQPDEYDTEYDSEYEPEAESRDKFSQLQLYHNESERNATAVAIGILFAKSFYQKLNLVADAFWLELDLLHRKDAQVLENLGRAYAVLQKLQTIKLKASDQILFRAYTRVLAGVLTLEKSIDAHMPRETDLQEMERILLELDETGFFDGIGSLIWRLRQVQVYTKKTASFLKVLLGSNAQSQETRRQFRALQDAVTHIMGFVGEIMLELAAPSRHGVDIGDDVLDAGDRAADQLENLGTVAQIGKTMITEVDGGRPADRLLTQVPQLALAMHNLIRRLRKKPIWMKGIVYVNISALSVRLRTMRWVEQNGGWIELSFPRSSSSNSLFTVDSVAVATENAFGLDPPLAHLVSVELFTALKNWDLTIPEDSRWTGWSDWSGCSVTCGAGGIRYKRRVCLSMDGIICEGKDSEESLCEVNLACDLHIPVVCPDDVASDVLESMPSNASILSVYRCSCEYVPNLCDNGGDCMERIEANSRGQTVRMVSCWCSFGYYGPYCEKGLLRFVIFCFIAITVGFVIGLLFCHELESFKDKDDGLQDSQHAGQPNEPYLKDSASEYDEWDYQETHGQPNQSIQQKQIGREQFGRTFIPNASPTPALQISQKNASSPTHQYQNFVFSPNQQYQDSLDYDHSSSPQQDAVPHAPDQSEDGFPGIRLEPLDVKQSESVNAGSKRHSPVSEEDNTDPQEETIALTPKPMSEAPSDATPRTSPAENVDVIPNNVYSPRLPCDIPSPTYFDPRDCVIPCYSPRMPEISRLDPCLSLRNSPSPSSVFDDIVYTPRYDCPIIMNFDSAGLINSVDPTMCGPANCRFHPSPEIIPAYMYYNQEGTAIRGPVPPIRSCLATFGIHSKITVNVDFVPSLAQDGLSKTSDRISKILDSCEEDCRANRPEHYSSTFSDRISDIAYYHPKAIRFNQSPMKRLIADRVTSGEPCPIYSLRESNSMAIMSGRAERMYTEDERQVASARATGAAYRVGGIGDCIAGAGSNPLLLSHVNRSGGFTGFSSNLLSGSDTLTRSNYFGKCTSDAIEQQEVLSEIVKSGGKKMAVEFPINQRVSKVTENHYSDYLNNYQVEPNEMLYEQQPSRAERRDALLSCSLANTRPFPPPPRESRQTPILGKLYPVPEQTKDLTKYRSFDFIQSPQPPKFPQSPQPPKFQDVDHDLRCKEFVDSLEKGAEMLSQKLREIDIPDIVKSPEIVEIVEEKSRKPKWMTTLGRVFGVKTKTPAAVQTEGNAKAEPSEESVALTPLSRSQELIVIHEGQDYKSGKSKEQGVKKPGKSSPRSITGRASLLSTDWKSSKRSMAEIEDDFLVGACTKSQTRLGKCQEVSSRIENRLKTNTKKPEEKTSGKESKKKKKTKNKGESLYAFRGEEPTDTQSEASDYNSEKETVLRVISTLASQPDSVEAGETKEAVLQNAYESSKDTRIIPISVPYYSPRSKDSSSVPCWSPRNSTKPYQSRFQSAKSSPRSFEAPTTLTVSTQGQTQVSDNISVAEGQTLIPAKDVQVPLPTVIITRPSRLPGFEMPYEKAKAEISTEPTFQTRMQELSNPRDRSKRFSLASLDRKKETSRPQSPRKFDSGKPDHRGSTSFTRNVRSFEERPAGGGNKSFNSSALSEFSERPFLSETNSDASFQLQVAATGEEGLSKKSDAASLKASDRWSGDRDQHSMTSDIPVVIKPGDTNPTMKSRFTAASKMAPGSGARFSFPSFLRSNAPPAQTMHPSINYGVYMRSFKPTWRLNRSIGDSKFPGTNISYMTYSPKKS